MLRPDGTTGGGSAVDDVRRSWDTIDRWLRAHAPASAAALPGPAAEDSLARAQRGTGLVWPDDVLASLRCHDGSEGRSPLPLLNEYLLPADEIAEFHEMQLSAVTPHDVPHPSWRREWLPIASADGFFDVVDLRPGAGDGRIGSWGPGSDFVAEWPRLATILGRTAAALATGTPFRYSLRSTTVYSLAPVLYDDELIWVDPGTEEYVGVPVRPAPPL
jgi:cell wall assembly regulator SMI1